MIQLEKINKTYNKGKSNEFQALRNVDLTIMDGEMVAVIGKSGAGKSTLLHILAGIDSFEKGSYKVGNVNVGELNEKRLALFRNEKVGIVMQDFALIEGYTVEENIMIPLIFGKVKSGKRKDMIKNVLEQLGISELRNKAVNKLSGGQKQRVAIARAIVNNPEFILADEPTGALDSQTATDIMNVFKELNGKGHTIVIVTHDLELAEQCGRIVEISDGRIA